MSWSIYCEVLFFSCETGVLVFLYQALVPVIFFLKPRLFGWGQRWEPGRGWGWEWEWGWKETNVWWRTFDFFRVSIVKPTKIWKILDSFKNKNRNFIRFPNTNATNKPVGFCREEFLCIVFRLNGAGLQSCRSRSSSNLSWTFALALDANVGCVLVYF